VVDAAATWSYIPRSLGPLREAQDHNATEHPYPLSAPGPGHRTERVQTRRRTVLFDATSMRMGSGLRGIGRFAFDLLQGLATTCDEWSPELEVVALTSLGVLPSWETTRDLRAAAEAAMGARGTEGESYLARRWAWLRLALRAERADLLFMPEARGVPPMLGVPRVVTCHDIIPLVYPQHYLGDSWRRRQQRWLTDLRRYRGSRRVVAISERSKRDLVAILGVPPERVDVVPNGVDVRRFADACDAENDAARLAELGIGSRPYVVFIGNGDWRKNVDGMFAAVAHASRNLDLELVWAGALAPKLLTRVRARARHHGIEGRLRLLGFVDDDVLPLLYRRALAHIFLSRLEGFGLTAVEAMASGCPVLVARGSATDEVAGAAGMVVEPDDAVAAGDMLVRLAMDPEERAMRVANGRTRAQVFGRERAARGYVQSFLRALGDAPRS
jgi:glycosyltransferase involved in cell wall biosynthesis